MIVLLVTEILEEIRPLSVKETIKLFENRSKLRNIQNLQQQVLETAPKQQLEMLYRNAFNSIMNPLFVFACIYAATQLILGLFKYQQNIC